MPGCGWQQRVKQAGVRFPFGKGSQGGSEEILETGLGRYLVKVRERVSACPGTGTGEGTRGSLVTGEEGAKRAC